ncbi:HNH endonuclease [Desulfonema ishimotonii]|uniref:HNH endonuclease n=1 Tax=Desulfonema ishimotonii TaxID=45657 RepID=A0A401G0R4_9BACT|nr:HNH endonuclease [Desulfonema ishimotonii]
MGHNPKSSPPPECLAEEKQKKSGDYKCGDVLERLKEDFRNKCYLCESKAPNTINVEHFIPHRGDTDLKFDWANLFLSCGHCNNTKLAKPEYDHILNCTDPEHDVENRIRYEIKPFPKEKAHITALDEAAEVRNTVFLLEAVYNGTTPLKSIESENIRKNLLDEIIRFQKLLYEFYHCTGQKIT